MRGSIVQVFEKHVSCVPQIRYLALSGGCNRQHLILGEQPQAKLKFSFPALAVNTENLTVCQGTVLNLLNTSKMQAFSFDTLMPTKENCDMRYSVREAWKK